MRIRLLKGVKAPFSGQLLSDAAIAKLLSDRDAELKKLRLHIELLERRAAIEKSTQDAICKTQVETEKAKYKALEDSKKLQKSILEGAIKRVEKNTEIHWYQSNSFHNLLGCAVCGGLCASLQSFD